MNLVDYMFNAGPAAAAVPVGGWRDLRQRHHGTRSRIVVSLVLGLGRGVVITAEDEQRLDHLSVTDRFFSGSLSARIGDRWQAVLRYVQKREESKTFYPIFVLESAALR